MKLYLFVLLLCSGLASAQPATAINEPADSLGKRSTPPLRMRHNVVKINPFSLALAQLSIFYERALSARLSVVVGYGQGSHTRNFGLEVEPGGGMYRRGTLEIRRYFSNQGLTGFYVGPYVRLARMTEVNYNFDQQRQIIKNSDGSTQLVYQYANVWVAGVLGGYQLQTGPFAFDAFIGIQHQSVVGTLRRSNQFVEALTAGGLVSRAGLTFGFSF